MQHWYVLHTKPHKERQVMFQLKQRSVEVYLPLIRVNPVNPRAARERAFFPGYLFTRLDLETVGPGSVQWVPGVQRFLEFGGQPASVADNAVAEIKRRVTQIMAAGGLVLDGVQPGDTVRIVSGPFAGYEAVFDARLSGSDRVRVLLEWIQRNQRHRGPGRLIPVELNVSNIEKAKAKVKAPPTRSR